MNGSVVLLCGRARIAAEPPSGATVIEDLCERPTAAADALRQAGATRAVLGLCHRRPSSELSAALHRAGAERFGIETVALDGHLPRDAIRLIEAAQARLELLPADEHGRPALSTGALSRRTLFSVRGVLTHAPSVALDEGACAGSSRCGLCIDRCPASAISAGATTPTIDVSVCTACGLCVPGCPHGALRLTGASHRQIEAQLERLATGIDGVVLACATAGADAPAGWALVELPTLALVTPGWLLQLRARGIEVALAPCDGPCCAGVTAVQECVDRVLEQRGPRTETQVGPIRLTEPAATADAVRALVPQGRAGAIAAEASPLGLLRMSGERCTLCSACAAACPTDALRFEQTPETTTLSFTAARCVGCGRCAAACPEHALTVGHGIDLEHVHRDAVELAQAARERCRDCGGDLPPRPMRRRLRELLPQYAAAPIELCAGCASKAARAPSRTITDTS